MAVLAAALPFAMVWLGGMRSGVSMKRIVDIIVSGLAIAALSGCGGGSAGSGVSSTPTPTPTPTSAAFSSFANVQAGSSTTVSGSTREGTLTVSSSGYVSPSTVSQPTEGSGSVMFSINNAKQITSLTVTGAQSNATFGSSATATSIYVGGIAVATALSNTSGSDQAIYIDPYAVGFNYQSYGVWGTGLVFGGSSKYGVISAGAKTNASAVPTSGSATYRGSVGGMWLIKNSAPYRYASNASFSVNFASRSIEMSTSDAVVTNISTNASQPLSGSISGTLTYSAGSNLFSGIIKSGQDIATQLAGTASGSFYGPSANELGGTFVITGPNAAIIGGFGAKQ